jgi:hypothetical protein
MKTREELALEIMNLNLSHNYKTWEEYEQENGPHKIFWVNRLEKYVEVLNQRCGLITKINIQREILNKLNSSVKGTCEFHNGYDAAMNEIFNWINSSK